MSSGSSTQEAGEASSSRARAVLHGAGPLVRLPEDAVAVEWWLARRAIENGDGVPYAEDGVLALWPERRAETDRWTFGLEFEFAIADAGWVAHELHARGLCPTPDASLYHGDRQPGFWTVEQDRSVTSVFHSDGETPPVIVGGEVVSPPLRDTPECWKQVATVLEVLRSCGAEVNSSCGLHVHFGVDALRDPTRDAAPPDDASLRSEHEPDRALLPVLARLAVLASSCFEDLVFRLASGEGGKHRGRAFFYRHCRPLERPLQAEYASISDLAAALGKEGSSRRAALNLTNVGDPVKDTVEFRQCNGTLDGRVVQAFCRLCAALVGAARWQPEAARVEPEPLGGHHSRSRHDGATRSDLSDADRESLWRFLAAVCPDGLPADAAASLLWLFRRGAWQPSLETLASN